MLDSQRADPSVIDGCDGMGSDLCHGCREYTMVTGSTADCVASCPDGSFPGNNMHCTTCDRYVMDVICLLFMIIQMLGVGNAERALVLGPSTATRVNTCCLVMAPVLTTAPLVRALSPGYACFQPHHALYRHLQPARCL